MHACVRAVVFFSFLLTFTWLSFFSLSSNSLLLLMICCVCVFFSPVHSFKLVNVKTQKTACIHLDLKHIVEREKCSDLLFSESVACISCVLSCRQNAAASNHFNFLNQVVNIREQQVWRNLKKKNPEEDYTLLLLFAIEWSIVISAIEFRSLGLIINDKLILPFFDKIITK